MGFRREITVESSRYQYKNSYEYAITVINLCVGVDNFFKFPYKVFRFRGGAFIIAYVIMILLLGYPLIYFELILGQFHRCSSAIFIRRCVPLLQGFGCLSMISAFAALSAYQYILVGIFKFVISLATYQSKNIPWSSCGHWWNTDDCYQFYSKQCPDLKKGHILFQNKCVNETMLKFDEVESAEVQYMRGVIENFGSSNSQFSNLDTEGAYLLFIMWIIAVIFQFRVGNSFTSFIYIPCVSIFLICPFFFIRSLHLEGAMEGIREMFHVEWSELLYNKIWINALDMVIRSLSIGVGCYTVLASMAKPKKNTFEVATLTIILDTALSLMVTATFYCTLGYIRVTTGKLSVYHMEFVPSDHLFPHAIYPVLLREVSHNAWLLACVFYFSIAVTGWNTCAITLKTIAISLADIFNIPMKSINFDLLFALLAAFTSFSGLILCFEGGKFYHSIIRSTQRISAGAFITVLMIVVIEFYGLKTVYEDIHILMGRPSKNQWNGLYAWSFWKWRWTMIPAFSMIYFTYNVFRVSTKAEEDLMYYYIYEIIYYSLLFLIVGYLIASTYYSYLKMLHHFEDNERKHFRFKCLVSLQRHLRSWKWIEDTVYANDKKSIDEDLPYSEPGDSEGFWNREYLNFFDSFDEISNVKKAKREGEKQISRIKKSITEQD